MKLKLGVLLIICYIVLSCGQSSKSESSNVHDSNHDGNTISNESPDEIKINTTDTTKVSKIVNSIDYSEEDLSNWSLINESYFFSLPCSDGNDIERMNNNLIFRYYNSINDSSCMVNIVSKLGGLSLYQCLISNEDKIEHYELLALGEKMSSYVVHQITGSEHYLAFKIEPFQTYIDNRDLSYLREIILLDNKFVKLKSIKLVKRHITRKTKYDCYNNLMFIESISMGDERIDRNIMVKDILEIFNDFKNDLKVQPYNVQLDFFWMSDI